MKESFTALEVLNDEYGYTTTLFFDNNDCSIIFDGEYEVGRTYHLAPF
jgi:hypothetical protein